MFKIILRVNLIFLIILSDSTFAQSTKENNPKGKFYISWGYNKDWFSKSDLHFSSKGNDDYDFIVYGATAHDRADFDKVFAENFSIPQFIYRAGYMFARHPNIGIEIGFDHAKYIMDQNMVYHVKGKIYENYIDKDTVVKSDFLRFEHTNGANFLTISLLKKNLIFTNNSGRSKLFYAMKAGGGIVIPQSEVALFGKDQNNQYHIAGYLFAADLELHYEFHSHLFLETGFKGVYANYLDVLSVANARANHHFFCGEWLLSLGYQFAL